MRRNGYDSYRGRSRFSTVMKVLIGVLLVVLVLGLALWVNRESLTPENIWSWVQTQVMGAQGGDGYPVSITGSNVSQGNFTSYGGNAVVLSEIPSDATAVGVPARVVRIAGEKVDYAGQVDQIHVTDPVQKELQALNSRLEWLEQLLDEQARSQNL